MLEKKFQGYVSKIFNEIIVNVLIVWVSPKEARLFLILNLSYGEKEDQGFPTSQCY